MTDNENKTLEIHDTQKVDYVVAAAKGVLGAVPFVGSLLSELAGIVIPNQRIDRIEKFAKVLAERINKIDEYFVKAELSDETFTDLLEEAMRQAAHSLTDERRDYIATLIVNSLTSKEIQHFEAKHLLKILDELNDIEIIWLRFYLVSIINGDAEFREKHKEILKPVSQTMGVPQAVRDKGTLQHSYKDHLAQLGLLLKDGNKYALAPLGRLLLREIGLIGKEQA